MAAESEECCPRCGGTLRRGFTPAHKVCLDCPNCGGRVVTLPVLRDGLGASGVAALSRAAREAAVICCASSSALRLCGGRYFRSRRSSRS